MSLLTMMQETCKRIGLPSPNQVVGSTDDQIIQLLAIANEEGEDLAERHKWSVLVTEATWSAVATQLQGVMTTLAPGFKYLLPDTAWNRTTIRRLVPISEKDWQSVQANSIAGPNTYIRIKGGNLYAFPVPTAGNTCAFEYFSGNWCESSAAAGQSAWAADADVGRLSEQIMRAGVIWRWKKAKGLDYAEDFRTYEARVINAISRDGVVKPLNFGGPSKLHLIGNQNVQEGSW